MTFQEILDGITRHRANRLFENINQDSSANLQQKIDEIEWALQALAEKLRDEEDIQ